MKELGIIIKADVQGSVEAVKQSLLKLSNDEVVVKVIHGGVGNIISALEKNKKVIAVPRLSKYGEHINDHQTQIIAKFNDLGYIIGLQDVDELDKAIKEVKKFKPQKFVHDNSKMLSLVSELIDK